MKTTYYLVTGTAVAVAALVVYAQLPNLNGPLPPATSTASAAPPSDVPRLALPSVSAPPDEPLVMPVAHPKPSELPPLPGAAVVPPLKAAIPPIATPVGYEEPTAPVPATLPTVPAVPVVPVTPTVPDMPLPPAVPSAPSPGPVVPPAVTVPPVGAEVAPPVVPSAPTLPLPAPSLPKPPDVPPAAPTKPEIPAVPAIEPPNVTPLPAAVPPPRADLKPQPAPVPPAKPLPVPAVTLQPPVQPTPAPLAPAVVGETSPPQGEPLPGTKYVVLKDDKILEGSVTLRGDVVVVRQGALDRPFAKGQVQFVADNKDEVYKFQLAKVPATDAVARLKVARWCMFSGMREQALVEAREVQKLQPNNTDAASLVRSLEQSLRQFPPADAPKMSAPAAPTYPAELSARPASPAVAVEADPELAPDAIKLFATKVQPILANQCVDCHAKPEGAGGFKLTRVDPAGATSKATRANLWAVAAQLRKDDPATSPLLLKSLQAHGGQKVASFATRQAMAYRTLEAWVSLAAGAPAYVAPVVPTTPAATTIVPMTPAAPALPPVGAPVIEPVLPPVGPMVPTTPSVPTVPAPSVEPVLPPVVPSAPSVPPAVPVVPPMVPAIPSVPTVPTPPSIPAADPLLPSVPAAPALPKPPTAPAVPAIPPASGFGETTPPKPTGPATGDEFDPAGFNQPVPRK